MVVNIDSRYTVETKELIFSGHNKNKLIDGQMGYVLGDYKQPKIYLY